LQTLVQEGASIIAFKLVQGGVFQEDGISALLTAPGLLEGNCGTRNLSDNISDLKAQVAANQKGALLMHELVTTSHLSIYLPTYLPTYPTYLPTYLPTIVTD